MAIGPFQLLLILLIVLVLFGAKRLRNIGSDLGEAIKGFKKSVKDEETKPDANPDSNGAKLETKDGQTIEGEVTKKKDKV